MGRSKLERFEDIQRFENALEYTDFEEAGNQKPKGRWREDYFNNHNPIILELACGKGAYTLALAGRQADRNFVGIDIKGSRIWKGARKAREQNLDNVLFLRIFIDHLEQYFGAGEVDEIWITFPDPYPKGSNRSKRLTSPKFLSKYLSVMKPGGTIHLKTDSEPLYEYTERSVRKFGGTVDCNIEDVYADKSNDDNLYIQTDFEKRHLEKGKTIKYLSFQLSG